MADDFQNDVFLSHNARDKPQVRRLAERLKQAGLRVSFDDWCVGAGDIIALKVEKGLGQSRVLLCVSPNALASGWVSLERSTAIHRDPDNGDRRFIPPLLADCYNSSPKSFAFGLRYKTTSRLASYRRHRATPITTGRSGALEAPLTIQRLRNGDGNGYR